MTPAAGPKPAGAALRFVAAAGIAVLGAFLIWRLRTLIVPVSAGGLLAYICRPFLARLERWGIARIPAVGLLLLLFGAATLACFLGVRTAVPSELAALELRVRALAALNERYRSLMGLDSSWRGGNSLYRWTHRDLDPLMDRLSETLVLTTDQRARFAVPAELPPDETSARLERLLERDRVNAREFLLRARRWSDGPGAKSAVGPPASPRASEVTGEPATLGSLLSPWLIAPLVFLFLLCDSGGLRRGLLRALPNRLFEPALAVLHDVDEALGNYLRGLFLECCALGLTVTALVALVGVPFRWAIVIGLFTGASNVVPYMGFVVALLGGLAYALLAENVHSLIPLVTAETFVLWVVAAVAFAELLKNVFYTPLVLGGSVKLHPVIVVLGVAGGATLFGTAGMLLAIPAITIVRVLVASGARHLKAYGLV